MLATSPYSGGRMQQGPQGSPVCVTPGSTLFLHAYSRGSRLFKLPCNTDICPAVLHWTCLTMTISFSWTRPWSVSGSAPPEEQLAVKCAMQDILTSFKHTCIVTMTAAKQQGAAWSTKLGWLLLPCLQLLFDILLLGGIRCDDRTLAAWQPVLPVWHTYCPVAGATVDGLHGNLKAHASTYLTSAIHDQQMVSPDATDQKKCHTCWELVW